MKHLYQSAGYMLLGVLMGLANPLYADETDLYRGGLTSNAGTQDRPNILFVLDRSGSMSTATSDGSTRMQSLIKALQQLLDEITNVNVGLMSFTEHSKVNAPLEFPIAYVDKPVKEICATIDGTEVCEYDNTELLLRLSSGADDGMEGLTSGNVFLNYAGHNVARWTSLDRVQGEGSVERTFSRNIDDGKRDAVQYINNGSVKRTPASNSTARGYLGSEKALGDVMTGLIFTNSSTASSALVPGAIIEEAYIEFTGRTDSSEPTPNAAALSLSIKGIVQPPTPTSSPVDFSETDNNISNRPLTTTSVTWNIAATETWANNGKYRTPSLKALVQEAVDHPYYRSGNDRLGFVFQRLDTSTGYRYFQDRDRSSTSAPLLVIKFRIDSNPIKNRYSTSSDEATEYREDSTGSPGTGRTYIGNTACDNTGMANSDNSWKSWNCPMRLGNGLESDGITQGKVMTGLRFTNVLLPPQAEIVKAYITFVGNADTDGTNKIHNENSKNRKDDISVKISAESGVQPSSFTTTGNPNSNLSARKRLTTNVEWKNIPQIENDMQVFSTPDLKELVQEVVNQKGWSEENTHMAFFFEHLEGEGSRRFYSRSESNGLHPMLTILWRGNAEPTQQIQVALRFRDVGIPQGAKITSATLNLTQSSNSSADPGAMTIGIQAEKAGNSSVLEATPKNISSRIEGGKGTTSVNWDITSQWSNNTTYTSPDISKVIEEVVAEPTWCGLNNMTLILTSSATDIRRIYSFEGTTTVDRRPTLNIKFDAASVADTACFKNRLTIPMGTAKDDMEETLSDNSVFDGSKTLEFSETGTTTSKIGRLTGIRFPLVAIPQGRKIEEATLLFTANLQDDIDADREIAWREPASIEIRGENSGDATPFLAQTENLSDDTKRPKTTKKQTWEFTETDVWEHGNKYFLDVTEITQEMIDNSKWKPYNALAYFLTGTGLRQAAAYERASSDATILNVTVEGTYANEKNKPVRRRIQELVSQITPQSATPLVQTIFEAGSYYLGKEVDYGKDRDGKAENRVSHFATYTGGKPQLSDGKPVPDICRLEPWNSSCAKEVIFDNPTATYLPPTVGLCNPSSIVFLTDGKPNTSESQSVFTGKILGLPKITVEDTGEELPPANCQEKLALVGDEFQSGSSTSQKNKFIKDIYDGKQGSGLCGVDMVRYLANVDLDKTKEGIQSVVTHTIGFGVDDKDGANYLRDWAKAGKGLYFDAQDSEGLLQAFRTIVATIRTQSTSFAAPTLSINTFTQLYHNTNVYLALFKPGTTVAWSGNVKKYTLCDGGGAVTGANCSNAKADLGKILDKDGNLVVDESSKKISDNAKNLWLSGFDAPDGGNVEKGGAGQWVPSPTERLIVTNTTGKSNVTLSVTTVNTGNGDSEVHPNNANITKTLLGNASMADADRTKVLNWMRGYKGGDTTAGKRDWIFGDPLHSSPGVITFNVQNPNDGNDDTARLFVATNEGGIRMIDSATGKEMWMFYPQETLKIQKTIMENAANPKRVYGLDGTPAFWVKDDNRNGVIESGSDFVKLYFGMRRGGSQVYGLDVSTGGGTGTGSLPKLMWTIEGGSSEFAELGQTWSIPQPAQVRFDGKIKTVLLFGGGYDPSTQDETATYTTATKGRAIYMVDPDTGKRLWWIGGAGSGADMELTGMSYSIPSDLALLDSNGDKVIDRIYVGDTGGQLWRIDLGKDLKTGERGGSVGGILASFGQPASGGTSVDSRRRFFYPPDVVALTDTEHSNHPEYDMVLISTGHRPEPLSDVIVDRLYAVRDRAINGLIPINTSGKNGNAKKDKPGMLCPSASSCTESSDGDDMTYFFTVTEDQLYDATENKIQDGDTTTITAESEKLRERLGWFLKLVEQNGTQIGEKGLSSPVVLEGKVFFTTFVPVSTSDAEVSDNPCVGQSGSGRLYTLDVLSGGSTVNYDSTNDTTDPETGGNKATLSRSDRSQNIGEGIPSQAMPIFQAKGVTVIVGSGGGVHRFQDVLKLPRNSTFWTH